MGIYYCTNCGVDLEEQIGFDPDAEYWICKECGQLLFGEEKVGDRFENVGWFCDECGAYLNTQSGFNDWNGAWHCEVCGYENIISEDQIFSSEEEYQKFRNNSSNCYSDDNYDDDDYSDDNYDDDDYDDDDYSDDNYDDNDYDEEYQDYMNEKVRQKEEEERIRQEEKRKRRQRIWRTLFRKKQTLGLSSEQCKKMQYTSVLEVLEVKEFYHIQTNAIEDLEIDNISKEGRIKTISFNGIDSFGKDTRFPYNAKIEIVYHALKRINPPFSSRKLKGKKLEDVVEEFRKAGFVSLQPFELHDLKLGWFVKENTVEKITIDGKSEFKEKDRIRLNAEVCIFYHTFKRKR